MYYWGWVTLNLWKGKCCNVKCTKVICNLLVILGLPILSRDFVIRRIYQDSTFLLCSLLSKGMVIHVD